MLEALELTGDEQQAYVELLGHSECTRDLLATMLPGWTTGRASAVLASLVRHGLLVRLEGSPQRFAAVPPDVAIQSLAASKIESLRRVQSLIPELMGRYWTAPHHAASGAIVEILSEDRESNDRRARQLMASATSRVRGFERPPHKWSAQEVDAAGVGAALAEDALVEQESLASGVRYQVIYDQTEVDDPARLPDIVSSVVGGEDARVFDGLPLKLVLFDDWGATTPLLGPGGEYAGLLVIHKSPLLDALSALFELFWVRATPLNVTGPASLEGEADRPSRRPDTLLTLLAAGLTDQAIARSLGVSRSTVQRRVNGLMAEHGARTRYQLGLQVGRSGSLEFR